MGIKLSCASAGDPTARLLAIFKHVSGTHPANLETGDADARLPFVSHMRNTMRPDAGAHASAALTGTRRGLDGEGANYSMYVSSSMQHMALAATALRR
jgi:hypothetical protein